MVVEVVQGLALPAIPVRELLLQRSIRLAGAEAVQLAGPVPAHQGPQGYPTEGSYTTYLLIRSGKDSEKVGEESTEVIIAGSKRDKRKPLRRSATLPTM